MAAGRAAERSPEYARLAEALRSAKSHLNAVAATAHEEAVAADTRVATAREACAAIQALLDEENHKAKVIDESQREGGVARAKALQVVEDGAKSTQSEMRRAREKLAHEQARLVSPLLWMVLTNSATDVCRAG